jgi:hypothetical protein
MDGSNVAVCSRVNQATIEVNCTRKFRWKFAAIFNRFVKEIHREFFVASPRILRFFSVVSPRILLCLSNNCPLLVDGNPSMLSEKPNETFCATEGRNFHENPKKEASWKTLYIAGVSHNSSK